MQNASEEPEPEPEPPSLLDLPPELVRLVGDALVCEWVEAAEFYENDPRTRDCKRGYLGEKERAAARTVHAMLAFRHSCRLGYDAVKPWAESSYYTRMGMNEGMDRRYARFALGHLVLWKKTRVNVLDCEQFMHVLAACNAAIMNPYKWVEVKRMPASAPRTGAGWSPLLWKQGYDAGFHNHLPDLLRPGGAHPEAYVPRRDAPFYWLKLDLDSYAEKQTWRLIGIAAIDKLMQERAEAWFVPDRLQPGPARDRAKQENVERYERARKVKLLLAYADRHNNEVSEGRVRSMLMHYTLRLRELEESVAFPKRLAHIAAHGWECPAKPQPSVRTVGV